MTIRKILLRLFWVLLLAALLYWALKNAPLTDIWSTLRRLQLWQIAALIGVNLAIYALVTLRWWIITSAEAGHVPYLPLFSTRLAVFGVSYFTLGPQVGGEPLQVLALRHRYGLTYVHATATVVMDKLVEFLGNFVLLAAGLAAVARAGILSETASPAWGSLTPLAAMAAWPPLHVAMLYRGVHPLGDALRAALSKKRIPKWARFVIAAERLAGRFCRRHPRALLNAIGASLLAAAGMVTEYALIASFLNIELGAAQTVAAWTASWLAFLVPWPGGLGALEASQVFALGAFGVSAAAAIGVTLVIRARDLFIGGIGALFASRAVAK
ncbi:MAG: lysylphosphatidylglycerol synthase transmembrane domain-containing protein [Chloroflexota bacterium]